MPSLYRSRRKVAALLCVLFAGGCGPAVTRLSVPQQFVETAQVVGAPANVRYWGDENSGALLKDFIDTAKRYPLTKDPNDPKGPGFGVLALSGGGDVGAYGAGLLCGWTERGDRPRFRIVTGVSTGALIAPMAFLGSDYDRELRSAYTTVSAEDLMDQRSLIDWLRYDSIADSRKLKGYANRIYTDALIDAVGDEHMKGRRLFVQTVNLDAQRPVIWDLGAIAAQKTPECRELFKQVLLASAAIPGVFPPAYIRVSAGGLNYDEMHVDGGTASQSLLTTLPVDMEEVRRVLQQQKVFSSEWRPRVHVIRNAYMRPEWEAIEPRLLPIAGRAVSTMIKSQGESELEYMFYKARDIGMDYYISHLPDDYVRKNKQEFNKTEMINMFDRGFQLGKDGTAWDARPPRLRPTAAPATKPSTLPSP